LIQLIRQVGIEKPKIDSSPVDFDRKLTQKLDSDEID